MELWGLTMVCGVELCCHCCFLVWCKAEIHLSWPPLYTPLSPTGSLAGRRSTMEWFWFLTSLFKYFYTPLEQRWKRQKYQCHCKVCPGVCLHQLFHMHSPKLWRLQLFIYFLAFLYTCNYQYVALRILLFLFPLLCVQFLVPSGAAVFFL